MKKKFLISTSILLVVAGVLSGCQTNYKISIDEGVIKNRTHIYYNENYTLEGYEWNDTDLIIHFKNNK